MKATENIYFRNIYSLSRVFLDSKLERTSSPNAAQFTLPIHELGVGIVYV